MPRAFYPSQDEEDDITRGYLYSERRLCGILKPIWNFCRNPWLDVSSAGQVRAKEIQGADAQRIYYDTHGNCADEPREGWMQGWFMTAPLLFDPTRG